MSTQRPCGAVLLSDLHGKRRVCELPKGHERMHSASRPESNWSERVLWSDRYAKVVASRLASQPPNG